MRVRVLLVLSTVLIAPSAHASTIDLLNTLGASEDYDSQRSLGLSNLGQGNVFLAVRFTPVIDTVLETIELALGHTSGPNDVTVAIAASSDTHFGPIPTAIKSFTLVDVLGPTAVANPLLLLASVLMPTLTRDRAYWILVTPGDGAQASWNRALSYTPVAVAFSPSGNEGSWQNIHTDSSDDLPPAVRIRGTALAPVPVPEPPTAALLTFGTCTLALVRIGRRKRCGDEFSFRYSAR